MKVRLESCTLYVDYISKKFLIMSNFGVKVLFCLLFILCMSDDLFFDKVPSLVIFNNEICIYEICKYVYINCGWNIYNHNQDKHTYDIMY